jgi:hypothetical protein
MDMMPTIYDQVRFAFRHELPERRQEMIAEAIANCWVSFVKLVERNLQDVIYATPLAQFAIRHVLSGRRVGGTLNKNDITSGYAQRMKQITVERLTRYNKRKCLWLEMLVEDRKAGPADTAAARIDFGDWLRTLGGRRRRIAETLATVVYATILVRRGKRRAVCLVAVDKGDGESFLGNRDDAGSTLIGENS